MYCGQCGAANGPENSFCARCGAAFPPPDEVQRVMNQQPTSPGLPHAVPTTPRTRPRVRGVVMVVASVIGSLIVLGLIGNAISPSHAPATNSAQPPQATQPPQTTHAAGRPVRRSRAVGTQGKPNPVLLSISLPDAFTVAVDERSGHVFTDGLADPAVSVIDSHTGRILHRVVAGINPGSLSVDPTTHHLFVVSQVASSDPNEMRGVVSMVDPDTGKVLARTVVGVDPVGLAVVPQTGHVFASNTSSNTVSMLDAATGALMATIPHITMQYASAGPLVVSVAANRIFVPSSEPHVYALDASSGAIARTIPTGFVPGMIAVDDRTHHLFVLDSGTIARPGNRVAMVDTVTGAILRTTTVCRAPVDVAADSTDGHVFVVCDGTHRVSMLSATSGQVLGTVSVGRLPQRVVVDERTHRVFVANTGSNVQFPTGKGPNSVSILDGRTGSLLQTVDEGNAPTDMAVALRANRVYVANAGNKLGTDGRNVDATLVALDAGSLSGSQGANKVLPVSQEARRRNAGASTQTSRVTNARQATLQRVDWANFTYTAGCGLDHRRPITVKGGKATTDGFMFTMGSPTFGDLTGDGQPEAVIPYQCTGADAGPTQFLIYTGRASHPTLLGLIPLAGTQGSADVPEPDAVSISHELLHIAGRGYSSTAPHCCPDLSIATDYRWTGTDFTVADSTHHALAQPTAPIPTTVPTVPALNVTVSVDPDPVIDNEPATIQASTTPGATCEVFVRYASGRRATSYSLRTLATADNSGVASWTWTPDTAYPGPASGTVTCSDGSQTMTNAVYFDVQ